MNLKNRREKLIYLAGIIDGEGSIGIEHLSPCKNRKKSYYVCRLCVINTDEKLIIWIKDNFGGSVILSILLTMSFDNSPWINPGDS